MPATQEDRMARMYPEKFPPGMESEAERGLFEQFRDEFSDDFRVFSQVRWLAKRRKGGASDGEADFIVAHPRYGILVLEVKGGGIRHDAPAGKYYSTDREGAEHEIKDPFDQARRSMYALKDKLRDAECTRLHDYPLAYAVAFPDCYIDEDLGPDAPREIIIDATKKRDLKQAVIDAFRFRAPESKPPGEEAMEALVELIGRSWFIEVTVGREIEEQERLIRTVTEEQYQTLDMLASQRRVLISGCAGSGKTMLSIEKAKRLAREGMRVLITCFNQNLGNWMATQVGAGRREEGGSRKEEGGRGKEEGRIEVRRFLSLCKHYADAAGIELEKRPGETDEAFFGRFPDALMDAAEKLPDDRFDAIIVDEGQDFEEEWWAALTSLLADPDDGILYIFYDDNQRLYNRNAAFPITTPPVHLTRNCRNTKRIHEAVMMFHESTTPPECIGPDGDAPLSLETTGDGRRDVEEYIDGLVGKQNVRPGDIAILTRRSRDKSIWANPPHRAAWSATWDLAACSDKVIISSIHAFKGLERPVVIVSEVGSVDPEEEAHLLYVAFSRAREVLVVAGLKR
jgi:hypothetical protein